MCRIAVKLILSRLVVLKHAQNNYCLINFLRQNGMNCYSRYLRVRMFSLDTKYQQHNSHPPSEKFDKLQKEQTTVYGSSMKPSTSFVQSIRDLNSLQNNAQTIASGRQKDTRILLPLFKKQLHLSGLEITDLECLKIIHISGTKGKGSTCAFVESILRAVGLRTGRYTSPHLVSVTERIAIDGSPIEETKFSQYFRVVFDRLKHETEKENIPMPGYFAFLTILAFHVFLKEKVDCVVLEVGIGGEYDPTNVIQKPIVCGITTIDYDHTNLLGSTIESIAWSKAGIAKKGVPLFTIEHEQEEAMKMIQSRSEEKGCPLYICKALGKSKDLELGIKGKVQYINAALACHLARYFLATVMEHKIESRFGRTDTHVLECKSEDLPDSFLNAIKSCSWAGRCQVLKFPRKTMYLDGAHTRKSMENCLDWFVSASGEIDSNVCRVLMVNVIGERSRRDVLLPLAQYDDFDFVIFSTNRIDSTIERSDSQTFMVASDDKIMNNVHNNVQVWRNLRKELGCEESNIIIKTNIRECESYINELINIHLNKDYHILVTGSLHFVGAVMSSLTNM